MGQLNDLRIKAAAPRDNKYFMSDGEGRYFRVRSIGKGRFYRYKRDGADLKLGLGPYPEVTLATARKKSRAEAESVRTASILGRPGVPTRNARASRG